MQSVTIRLSGKYGHFKRPDTNDNPCTFSYMHKIALIGFIGAVTGIEREEMIVLYPQLCEDLLYSIRILNERVVKEPHAFTKRNTLDIPKYNSKGKENRKYFYSASRRYCEYLIDPAYEITIALLNKRSKEVFDTFSLCVREGYSVYSTSFGVVNCPAFYDYISEDEVSDEMVGEFETLSVFTASHIIKSDLSDLDLISEWIPTHTSRNMYYTPSGMIQTVCSQGASIKVLGPYRIIKEKALCFL
jgi:CRISPR-associated protein Cas5 subtype I-B